MKKLLLLCPQFMKYDEKIMHSLKKYFDVRYVNTNTVLAEARDKYYDKPIYLKGMLKLYPSLREKYREEMIEEYDSYYMALFSKINIKDFSIIFVINGDGISNKFYSYLRKKYINAKLILYLWDDVCNLFKVGHLKYFDKIVSYNIADCKKKSYRYFPMFTVNSVSRLPAKKYDICIIGTASKKRIRLAKKIYGKYKNKYKFYIYFYSKSGEGNFYINSIPLSLEDYMMKIAESRVVIEDVRCHQKGPTTRVADAMSVRTKVATTNRHIIEYPLYNGNIMVITKKYNIPEAFVWDEYVETEFISISVDEWLHNILNIEDA